MEADAAGLVSKAHNGAVWGRGSDFRPAHQRGCQKLPAGVPSQVMNLACFVLPVLLAIPGNRFLLSNSNWKWLPRPSCNKLEMRTASSWLQKDSLPFYKIKYCKTLQRHCHHDMERDMTVNITSTDSAPSRTGTKNLFKKYEKCETAALRQNYRRHRVGPEIELTAAPLDTVRSAVTHMWSPKNQNYLTLDCVGRKKNLSVGTLRSLRNSFVLGKVRLKPAQTAVPVGLHSFL